MRRVTDEMLSVWSLLFTGTLLSLTPRWQHHFQRKVQAALPGRKRCRAGNNPVFWNNLESCGCHWLLPRLPERAEEKTMMEKQERWTKRRRQLSAPETAVRENSISSYVAMDTL